MAEALGAAGSIVGIVAFGLQFVTKIQMYIDTVENAENSFRNIALDISATASALDQINRFIEEDRATAEKGEVATAKSGLPLAKQELSREDKARMRRRQKERIRKAGGLPGDKNTNTQGAAAKAKASGARTTRAQQQKDTLGDLRKGGVKVINKKGEVLDMEGNKAKAARAATSGSFKL